MKLQKSLLSGILGAVALMIGLILFQVSAKEIKLSSQIQPDPRLMDYDELVKANEITGNRHIFVQDSLRGNHFAVEGDSLYTPIFSGFQEGNGDRVRLIAKIDGFGNSDEAEIAAAFEPNQVHGIVWENEKVPHEVQGALRKHYPFISFSRCKIVDLTYPIPEKKVSQFRIAAFALFGVALTALTYAFYAAWKGWQFVENKYTILDKSTLSEDARKFFAAQSERLERLGFKRVCDLSVNAKQRATVRTFVSSDLRTVAVIESTPKSASYRMGSIATDGTYLRTCSKGEPLEVKVTPVVEFQAPNDDAALGYAAHHKGCLALESDFNVERLVIDPRSVLGFLDYDNRVTSWAEFEHGAGGRPEPLPSAVEIQKERGNMHIFQWAATERTPEDLTAAGA